MNTYDLIRSAPINLVIPAYNSVDQQLLKLDIGIMVNEMSPIAPNAQ